MTIHNVDSAVIIQINYSVSVDTGDNNNNNNNNSMALVRERTMINILEQVTGEAMPSSHPTVS
jgi:hypothetical protein